MQTALTSTVTCVANMYVLFFVRKSLSRNSSLNYWQGSHVHDVAYWLAECWCFSNWSPVKGKIDKFNQWNNNNCTPPCELPSWIIIMLTSKLDSILMSGSKSRFSWLNSSVYSALSGDIVGGLIDGWTQVLPNVWCTSFFRQREN